MDSYQALWIKFEKSGKLTDYLSFCEERRRASSISSGTCDVMLDTGKPDTQSSL